MPKSLKDEISELLRRVIFCFKPLWHMKSWRCYYNTVFFPERFPGSSGELRMDVTDIHRVFASWRISHTEKNLNTAFLNKVHIL